ncbi:SLAM family member 5-like isoform X6 [Oncorhynchus keta]|uniref:SLAM family member 5-like isoform X6 n=1 Tax=Oncorhynchus keta TaxID=8018 RepID=UPI00227A0C30|nr:SLAM family member 5-like isoform X6 [Oncorhynchus keta]
MNHLFRWRRIARLVFVLLYFVINVLCASQQTVNSETQQVKGIMGKSLSFPERVFKTGYLRYGEDTTASVINGQSHIDSDERFKNRLHWDNVTGLFSLSDLQIEDAGVYSVENKDGEKRIPKFNLTLYYLVSKPQVTECDSSSCSVVCSVDNEKEVTLTLYRGDEILNQTSSPDLTTDLSLRLEVEVKNYNSTYSCVASNPVSNETVLVPKCCSEDGHPKETGLVGLAINLRKRGNEHSQDSSEGVQVDNEYATITYIKQTDNQEERRGIPELESRRDNSEMASVYDSLQLHRMAASGDVDTA